jgi:Na+/proline symporter
MNFEDLQKAWQSQDPGAKVTINADVLLKEVRRNQQQFQAMILWRDVREVVGCLLLMLYFLYHGIRHDDWTDYLMAMASFSVGTFMLVDRVRQRRKRPAANHSLKSCIETSLHQVNHQVWLLKNVFWWALLPFAAAVGISIGHSVLHARNPGLAAMIIGMAAVLFITLVYWGIYWVNQFAVRKCLEPRRQELETLLASLDS